MSKIAKNILFFLFSTFAGAVLMWWTCRGFPIGQLAHFFSLRTNYVWIILTLLAGIAANVLRALRWRSLLRSADIRISTRRSVELVFIAYLVNSVTPRLGELLRALLVKRGNASVSSRALGTVVVEKMADVGCLIVLLALVVSLRWSATLGLLHGTASRIGWAGPRLIALAATLMTLLVVLSAMKPLRRRICNFLQNMWQGMSAIARLKSPLTFAALCLGIWACNFLQLMLLVPCFDSLADIRLADMLHVFAAASVGALLPTPAGTGTWHFAITRTLTRVYGIERTVAQAFALITHGLKTALVMLLGVLGYASYYSALWEWWRRNR